MHVYDIPEAPPEKPETVADLFRVYHKYVKPLYSHIEALMSLPASDVGLASLPEETGFEALSCIDHLSRHYVQEQAEEEAVDRAAGHLKRLCFDLFKLIYHEHVRQFAELKQIDTSALEHGEYDRRLVDLHGKIRDEAKQARLLEGDAESWGHGFAHWWPVYAKCVKFEKEIYRHDKIPWVKKRNYVKKARPFVLGVITGVGGSYLKAGFDWLIGLFGGSPGQ